MFDFADVNHIISTVDKQVDLSAFPLSAVFVDKWFAGSRANVTDDPSNA